MSIVIVCTHTHTSVCLNACVLVIFLDEMPCEGCDVTRKVIERIPQAIVTSSKNQGGCFASLNLTLLQVVQY